MPTINPGNIVRIVEKHQDKRAAIITILEDIQTEYNYLPQEALQIVSKKTNHSLVDIYGIATFYTSFSLEPRGKHLISTCVGTACHVRSSSTILEEFEKVLGIKAGQTTEDKMFSLTTVNCLGACALGPVVVIDGQFYSKVKHHQVSQIVKETRQADRFERVADEDRILRMSVSCPRCNRSLMTDKHEMDGQPMIHVTVSFARKHGWMRLSSLWGDYRIESEHEIPKDTILDFFCPRCHAEFRTTSLCPRCDAPTIPLLVRGGGIMKICSRRGCKEHHYDVS